LPCIGALQHALIYQCTDALMHWHTDDAPMHCCTGLYAG